MTVAVTVLEVPSDEAELAADRLMQAGAFAVEERRADGGRVSVHATLGAQATAEVGQGLPAGWQLRVEHVDERPLDSWRAFVDPIEVAPDLVIRPAWLPPLGRPGVREVAIEPGAAFGLGDHPTTRLCAALAWRLSRPGWRVLDVGCGTGALAIIAAMAGAQLAVGTDVAEAAVTATLDNAERNRVADRVQAFRQPLDAFDTPFDLVLANILAPTLIELADDLVRLTAPDATLVISGILAGRHDHVVAALSPMVVVATHELDGWAAVELRHHPGGAG